MNGPKANKDDKTFSLKNLKGPMKGRSARNFHAPNLTEDKSLLDSLLKVGKNEKSAEVANSSKEGTKSENSLSKIFYFFIFRKQLMPIIGTLK